MKRLIVHVAEVELGEETGMGRISWHWRRACNERGWEFIHIGPAAVGGIRHPAFFPHEAHKVFRALNREPDLFLVHEPAAAPFLGTRVPVVLFSHGIERRWWELRGEGAPEPLRTRLLFPLWRLGPCDAGLRGADAAMFSNEEDSRYAARQYNLPPERRWVFPNGVYPTTDEEAHARGERLRILFLASWIERKGIHTLARTAAELHRRGIPVEWTLAGVGKSTKEVLAGWPRHLAGVTTVIPSFPASQEAQLLRDSDVMVLPTFFEGQPLSLLQAMEAGRCCITTNCCGQRDVIKHRENGLLFEAGDDAALTELLAECARDETLRRELGRRAKASMRNRSWPEVAARVADQLDSVIRSRRWLPESAS